MITRRGFITLCCGCGLALDQSLASNTPKYCSLDASFDVTNFRRMSSSGNKSLDNALIAEVKKINSVFSIRPGYQYIDDSNSPNAFAHTATIISNTRGTVFFGLTLVKNELSGNFGGAAVAGIAAHEGAHILQFFSNFVDRLRQGSTAREMELHADFLAGFYFSQTSRAEKSLDVFGSSLFRIGDYDFNDPNHHGTPDERLKAMHVGYSAGKSGLNLNDAIEKGIDHVTS